MWGAIRTEQFANVNYNLLMQFAYILKELRIAITPQLCGLKVSISGFEFMINVFGLKVYAPIMRITSQGYTSVVSLFSGIHFSSIPAFSFNLPM